MAAPAVLSRLFAGDIAEGTDADHTEERILAAAVALFNEFGLKRTSMEDVARRAGVGRATIYRRFAQKDDLVRAAILGEGTRFLDLIRSATAGIKDREEALVSGFVLTVVQASTHPLIKRLLSSEPETILPYLTVNAPALVDISRVYFRRVLEEEAQRGLAIRGNLDDVAELMVRLLHSLVLTPSSWINAGDEAQLRRFGRDILRHFL